MAATLDARRAYADAIDAEGTPEGWAERPSDRVALEKVQQAWQAFRDTACTYEAQQYWGGTGMGGAGLSCQMRLTAEQVFYLQELADHIIFLLEGRVCYTGSLQDLLERTGESRLERAVASLMRAVTA